MSKFGVTTGLLIEKAPTREDGGSSNPSKASTKSGFLETQGRENERGVFVKAQTYS